MSVSRKTVTGIKCDGCRREIFLEGVKEAGIARLNGWKRIVITSGKLQWSWGNRYITTKTVVKHFCVACEGGDSHTAAKALAKTKREKLKKLRATS